MMTAPDRQLPTVGPPRGRLVIEERREKVAALMLAGYSVRQITSSLSAERVKVGLPAVPRRTIEDDMEHVRPALRKVLDATKEDRTADALAQLDQVQRALWDAYLHTPLQNVSVRLQFLMSIGAHIERRIRVAQSLGVLDAAPAKVELAVTTQLERTFEQLVEVVGPDDRARLVAWVRERLGTPAPGSPGTGARPGLP
jgi:hypothetical protein